MFSRKNSPSTPQTADFGPFFVRWANFFALTPTISPSRANYFAHRTQRHDGFETDDTSAAADAGQHETAITTARLRTATVETTITSATEKRTKYIHFSTAKAMSVSHERFVMPAGYGGAWPSSQRAADVTNVVKPTQFKSPCECSCYKRRQSASKNLDFQRKSRRIDDVCNNHSGLRTKSCSD